jgi:P27 family predicted phage terminase small subunit
MGRRGPLPKPVALKLIEGNPGKRRVRARATAPAGAVSCPTWLTGEARVEWRRLAPALAKAGLLTPLDRSAFATYCESFASWKQCQRVVEVNGPLYLSATGRLLERPEVSMALKFAKEVRELGAEFGLSPASRARLDVNEQENCCWRCSLPLDMCGCS